MRNARHALIEMSLLRAHWLVNASCLIHAWKTDPCLASFAAISLLCFKCILAGYYMIPGLVNDLIFSLRALVD